MLRSLFAGVSGLRNHQVRMDVIGNNIANVNTVGFKASRVNFAEALSQTIRGAQAPSEARGGVNAMQVGLGVQVGSIDTLFTQGNLQYTGNLTDLAVQGDGFLVVGDGLRRFYTRDGAIVMDSDGNLVHASSGLRLMGWQARRGGRGEPHGRSRPLDDPRGGPDPAPGHHTSRGQRKLGRGRPRLQRGRLADEVRAVGNHPHRLRLSRQRRAAQAGLHEDRAEPVGVDAHLRPGRGGDGSRKWHFGVHQVRRTGPADPDEPYPWTVVTVDLQDELGSEDLTFELRFEDPAGKTQYGGASTVALGNQDGYASGSLESFAIDGNGVITGLYSNGRTQVIGQVALALFTNPGGLLKAGNNLYAESSNSGPAAVGAAGTGGRGALTPGALEMSNVDLAQEFTNMITAQRGFQANARVITTSDELLQELISLRR
jgi:flagellar hook protein FlgE